MNWVLYFALIVTTINISNVSSVSFDIEHRLPQIYFSNIHHRFLSSVHPTITNCAQSLSTASSSQPQTGADDRSLFSSNLLRDNCTEHYITQYLDHFNFHKGVDGRTTYSQRYFICGNNTGSDNNWSPNGTIFFYTGNEDTIELYINNTGLMWENAGKYNAIMIFAEHRYFGKSFPFGLERLLTLENKYWQYLSSDQAIADYAYLLYDFKNRYNSINSNVIGFGGSYGGMLCTWMKIKYPTSINTGCIAGSAPITSFLGQIPPLYVDPEYFAKIETFDATSDGGVNISNTTGKNQCKTNIHQSWDLIFNLSKSETGRRKLKDYFNLCTLPVDESEGDLIATWISAAFGSMTMGSYPYPCSYMVNGGGELPSYPMIRACDKYLNVNYSGMYINDKEKYEEALLTAMGQAAGIFYNYTGDLECFIVLNVSYYVNNLVSEIDDLMVGLAWDYLYCTQVEF